MTSRLLFTPGNIVITDRAVVALKVADVVSMMRRHLEGDWSEMDDHDRRQNQLAVQDGSRVFSQYTSVSGVRIWVITEADRSTTTILLPEEY